MTAGLPTIRRKAASSITTHSRGGSIFCVTRTRCGIASAGDPTGGQENGDLIRRRSLRARADTVSDQGIVGLSGSARASENFD